MATPEPIPEDITQELYKRNAELAIKNKTLSLLGKLYEISILALEPAPLAERITQTIQTELDFDLVGIFRYDDLIDELTTLHFAKSKRLEEVLGNANKAFDSLKISEVSQHVLFGPIFSGSAMGYTEDLTQVWDRLIPQDKLEIAREEAHLRTIMLYPLAIGNREILGVLIVGLNRAYDNLGEFEQESIRNFVNVIATALDKAVLYQELQITNVKLGEANNNLNRANEALKKLDKAKSEFVSIASHQLRTPLTAVKGYISLILEGMYGKLPGKMQKPVENVYESNERLIRLVNDLLNLSRIESGKMGMQWEEANVENLAQSVVEELSLKAKEKNLRLTLAKLTTPLPIVRIDQEKIRNVILNLVDNAIRYTDKGSITVNAGQMQDKIRITISDTGAGMTKEELESLFESFVRGKAGVQNWTEGAGLGLYIAKQFTQMHNGTIWAESEGKGKGSTFFVELPINTSSKV